jgi:cytochrome bd-type quinol oxidase subunit 2
MLIQIIGLIYLIRKTVRTCQDADIRATKYVFAVIGLYILIIVLFLFATSYFISNGSLSPSWTQLPLNLILALLSVLIAGLCCNLVVNKVKATNVIASTERLSDNEELLDD